MDGKLEIIAMVVTAVLGWLGKGMFGRFVEDAKTKKFLQSEIDALYNKVNVLLREQLIRDEKVNQLTRELARTKEEIQGLRIKLNLHTDEGSNKH